MHAARLQESLTYVANWPPLRPAILAARPGDKISILDMMTLRFSKLQDILGTKIFGLRLAALGEDPDALIDKLNKLERLNYIADINWWMDLREMHNQFAHDYPDDYDLIPPPSYYSLRDLKNC